MTDSTPEMREAAYWKDIADRRFRLAALTLLLGVVLGFIFHVLMAMPPVWMDDIATTPTHCEAYDLWTEPHLTTIGS